MYNKYSRLTEIHRQHRQQGAGCWRGLSIVLTAGHSTLAASLEKPITKLVLTLAHAPVVSFYMKSTTSSLKFSIHRKFWLWDLHYWCGETSNVWWHLNSTWIGCWEVGREGEDEASKKQCQEQKRRWSKQTVRHMHFKSKHLAINLIICIN
jgi:hypothetical protein